MNQNEYNKFERMVNEVEGQRSLSMPVLMRKVYIWMAMALAITGVTSYGIAVNPHLMSIIFSNTLLFWGIIIAEFALVVLLSARLHKLSLTTGTLMFILYSVLNGVVLSSIFIIYTMSSIATTFFICAGTFAAMSIYGSVTRTDLSKMGSIMIMALFGLIIATVVNIFVKSSALMMIVSYIGVLVFVGLTAYDTQKLKVWLSQVSPYEEEGQKIALMGALSLYLDFVNLFIYLLRIFGRRD